MLRSIILSIFFVFLLLIAATGVSYLLPGEISLSKSATIKAPLTEVYAMVSDFNRFNQWQPWAKRDPKMAMKVSGVPGALGHKMTWNSQSQGAGGMELIEVRPASLVRARMNFSAGAMAFSRFDLKPNPDGSTQVTWGFFQSLGLNPVNRYMGLVLPGWIEQDYSDGLSSLKQYAEGGGTSGVAQTTPSSTPSSDAKPTLDPNEQALSDDIKRALTDKEPQPTPVPTPEQVAKTDPDMIDVEARPIIYVSTRAKAGDTEAMSKALGSAYNVLINYVQRQSLEVSGAPIMITRSVVAGERLFDAAIPLASEPTSLPDAGPVKLGKLPEGRAIMKVHKGPHSSMGSTYDRLRAQIQAKGLKEAGPSWEEYVTDAAETPEEELLTNVYILVQ